MAENGKKRRRSKKDGRGTPEPAPTPAPAASPPPAGEETSAPEPAPESASASAATKPEAWGAGNGERKRRRDDIDMGRAAVPPELNDPRKRGEWELPAEEDKPGPYMIELNLQHVSGLAGAASAFLELYDEVLQDDNERKPRPLRVSKTYYSCKISVKEWRQLVAIDEDRAEGSHRKRCIYRVWPDFPVRPQVDRSVATVKGDASPTPTSRPCPAPSP